MKVYVFSVVEDQRRSLKTIKTRRSRLARVLRGALNARRAAKQTVQQSRAAGQDIEKAPSHPHPKMAKALNRLQILTQRHMGLQKKFAKRLVSAGRPSKLGPYHQKIRARSDMPERPANPKTYGRGKKDGPALRKAPKKTWKNAP